MQPQYLVRARRFSLGALLLVGLASLSAFGGETSPEADRNALSLGTVTVLGPATCLSGSIRERLAPRLAFLARACPI